MNWISTNLNASSVINKCWCNIVVKFGLLTSEVYVIFTEQGNQQKTKPVWLYDQMNVKSRVELFRYFDSDWLNLGYSCVQWSLGFNLNFRCKMLTLKIRITGYYIMSINNSCWFVSIRTFFHLFSRPSSVS